MVVRLHLERTLNVLVLVSIVVFISSIVLLSQPAASFVVKGGKQRSCCCFDSPKSKLPLISGSHFALKPFEEDGEAFDPSVLLKEKQKQWKRMQALKKAGVIDDAEDMLMIEEIESKYGVTINSQADLDALDLTEEVSEDEVLEKQISKEEEEAWVEFEEEESYAEFEAARAAKQKQWGRMRDLIAKGVIEDSEDMLMIEEIERVHGVTINSQEDLDALDSAILEEVEVPGKGEEEEEEEEDAADLLGLDSEDLELGPDVLGRRLAELEEGKGGGGGGGGGGTAEALGRRQRELEARLAARLGGGGGGGTGGPEDGDDGETDALLDELVSLRRRQLAAGGGGTGAGEEEGEEWAGGAAGKPPTRRAKRKERGKAKASQGPVETLKAVNIENMPLKTAEDFIRAIRKAENNRRDPVKVFSLTKKALGRPNGDLALDDRVAAVGIKALLRLQAKSTAKEASRLRLDLLEKGSLISADLDTATSLFVALARADLASSARGTLDHLCAAFPSAFAAAAAPEEEEGEEGEGLLHPLVFALTEMALCYFRCDKVTEGLALVAELQATALLRTEDVDALARPLAKARLVDELRGLLRHLDARGRAVGPGALEALGNALAATVKMEKKCSTMKALPAPRLPEIVLMGRSNAGKSSLVNMMLNRKAMASTSATPGRTRHFSYYRVNRDRPAPPAGQRQRWAEYYLVDVPGLGFAETVDQGKMDGWRGMIERYLRVRESLRAVLHLVDSRHGLQKADYDLLQMVKDSGFMDRGGRYFLVLTKADKDPKQAAATAAAVRADLCRAGLRPDASPLDAAAAAGGGEAREGGKGSGGKEGGEARRAEEGGREEGAEWGVPVLVTSARLRTGRRELLEDLHEILTLP